MNQQFLRGPFARIVQYFQCERQCPIKIQWVFPGWSLIVMILFAFSGCHSIERIKNHRLFASVKQPASEIVTSDSATSTAASEPTTGASDDRVSVGGQVRLPQLVDFHSKLSLGRALALCGGLDAHADAAFMLVRLRTGHGILKQDVFIPFHYAMDSLASEILVAPGSDIRVIDARSTSLQHEFHQKRVNQIAAQSPKRNDLQSFSIAGMVTKPGEYQASEFQRPMLRWSELFSSAIIHEQSDLAIVLRPTITGIGKADIFLLPLAMPADFKNEMAKVPKALPNLPDLNETAINSTTTSTPPDSIRSTYEDVLAADTKLLSSEGSPRLMNLNEMFVVPGDQVVFTRATTVPWIVQGLTAPIRNEIHSAFGRLERERMVAK